MKRKFKIGDKVRVIRGRSSASKIYEGQIATILRFEDAIFDNYVVLDIDQNGFGGAPSGIWTDELQLVKLDKDGRVMEFSKDTSKKMLKTLKRKMSKTQLYVLQQLSKSDQDRYLDTFLGMGRNMRIAKLHKSTGGYESDVLAEKRKGHVLNLLREMGNVDSSSYRPDEYELGKWIGVEIECLFPVDEGEVYDEDTDEYHASDSIKDLDNDLRQSIRDAKLTRVSMHEDGSLNDEDKTHVAREFSILLHPKYGREKLEKLLNIIKKHGGYVNTTCGLHIHLDCRNLTDTQAIQQGKYLGRALPLLSKMVPKSRIGNQYCELNVGPLTNDRDERYYAINMVAFKQYKTIEVRLHSGTLSYEKIVNWIDLLQAFRQAKLRVPVKSFQHFLDRVPVSEKLIEYVEKRIKLFNPDYLGYETEMRRVPIDTMDSDYEAERVRQVTSDDDNDFSLYDSSNDDYSEAS